MAAGLDHFREVFAGRVGMGFLYIQEAHAEDEWPVATPKEYSVSSQHTQASDRADAACKMSAVLPPLAGFPMYADSMENKFSTSYGAWPTRLFFFNNGSLVHKADAVDATFDLMAFWKKMELSL